MFAGSSSPEAAGAVAGLGQPAPAPGADPAPTHPPPRLLAGLAALVDHSLLRLEVTPDGAPRYAMLETVREYALERLDASGAAEAARRRHARYFAGLAAGAEPRLQSATRDRRLRGLVLDDDNLWAALRWAVAREATEIALGLAGAPLWFWGRRNSADMLRWYERVLALPAGRSAAAPAASPAK